VAVFIILVVLTEILEDKPVNRRSAADDGMMQYSGYRSMKLVRMV
jgi:hypothetical protein